MYVVKSNIAIQLWRHSEVQPLVLGWTLDALEEKIKTQCHSLQVWMAQVHATKKYYVFYILILNSMAISRHVKRKQFMNRLPFAVDCQDHPHNSTPAWLDDCWWLLQLQRPASQPTVVSCMMCMHASIHTASYRYTCTRVGSVPS